MTSYIGRAVQGSSTIFFISLFTSVGGYFVRLLFARKLTPEEFGLFYAVFAFLSIIIAFRSLGVNTALAKFTAEFRMQKDWARIKTAARYYLIIESSVYICMVIALLFSAQSLATLYFKNSAATPVLFLLIIAFGFSLLESLYGALFHGLYEMKYYALLSFFRNLFVFGAAWVMFTLGFGVAAPAWAYVIAYGLTGILAWWWYRALLPKATRPRRDIPLLKRMFSYGASVFVTNTTTVGLANVDTVILTSFTSLVEVGWYNVALPTSNVVRHLFRSIATVLFPLSSELYAAKNPAFAPGVTKLYRYVFALVVPCAIGLATLSSPVLLVFFGSEYVPASAILAILSIGLVFSILFMIVSNILNGIGAVVSNSIITVGGSLVLILGGLITVPFFGVIGVASANTFSQFVMMFAALVVLQKKIDARIPWSAWIRTMFCAGTIPLVILLINYAHLPLTVHLGVSVLLAGGVYLLGIFLLQVVAPEEVRAMFRAVIRVHKHKLL